MSSFLKNVSDAAAGIKYFIKNERSARIQAVIIILVLVAGFTFNLSNIEWAVILLCIALVYSLEMVNTAIERVCNLYSEAYHPLIKIIKDVAAGAVLFSVCIAIVIGMLILLPYVKIYITK